MDRLFTTEDMTTCLRQYAGDLRPVLSMHSMRHLSIAIRRKLCPGYVMEEMLEDDSADDHVGAAMTGHSVQVERLKYAVSVDSLAGNVGLQVEVNKDLMINDNVYVQFVFSRANRWRTATLLGCKCQMAGGDGCCTRLSALYTQLSIRIKCFRSKE